MNQDNKDSVKQKIEKFVNQAPEANYIIDDDQLAICRARAAGEDRASNEPCVHLGVSQKEMFTAMQDLGFYCALPSDPTETYFKCQKI
ncbi:hypothetical protein CONCODRAFT_77786 [Conidiobolus coronatus NRRL 28638]|uniref:Uncharacterized protein n=1 Tax=Conidiobolus coronatus (strain ATCC 28846 / CBS 209.66 / NRRL 28638) TaxID=796925 RepID=A0A137PBN1_CONC2|nr:hypothetical protein CONCODRAFT_77786 [Conidiobolus coronatus NRRL 28638]|eukprot:KXN72417.1 hypothetical protein CONCODRAFT_77786 [Conidiobolus coronatus NRRL 28638]